MPKYLFPVMRVCLSRGSILACFTSYLFCCMDFSGVIL